MTKPQQGVSAAMFLPHTRPSGPAAQDTVDVASTSEAVGDGLLAEGAAGHGPVAPSRQARQTLRPLRVDRVVLHPDGLLGSWQRRNIEATLPHCLAQIEASGALPNLRRAATVPHVGMWFSDSDVYKTLEAMAWALAVAPDAALTAQFDAIVAVVDAAQEADGYLNSYFQHATAGRRWQELPTSHELYCAGHLIQAAVAADRAGVGARLMPIARRFADLIVDRFGPSGEDAVCGHPEIETALVELYRATGQRSYLDTARAFVDRRGRGLLGEGQFGRAYFQDQVEVRAATEFIGHAVRQLYLLAGVVDVAVETGDDELLDAAERLWRSAYDAKTYVTGGHGSRHRDEAVGDAYELPSDRAYAETCAAIGSFQWNWRLLLATGEHRYADEMERTLYNAIAAAISLDGRNFFYSNPLQLRTGHHDGEDAPSQRLAWYRCACCPPNLARLIGSLHSYLVTADDTGLQVHQYTSGDIEDGDRSVRVATGYPWDGAVRLTVTSADQTEWTLALRVPSWCTSFELRIDGVATDVSPVDGYLRLTRVWTGQTVELDLALPTRLIAPHPRVDAIRGCVALARGPLVYALEHVDLPAGLTLEDVVLDLSGAVRARRSDPSSPIPISVDVLGQAVDAASTPLYRTPGIDGEVGRATPVPLTAVPYFLWGNRRPGAMRVWIPVAAPSPAQLTPSEGNLR